MRRAAIPLIGAVAFLRPTPSYADEPNFGAFDIPTVFFIDKSDDRNRVDYGMRLDERCGSKGDAVFPYWREFEHAPPVRTHSLGTLEPLAYGIAEQRVLRRSPTGTESMIRLKQFPRPIFISTQKGSDGHCKALARTTIAGVDGAQLLSVHVQLAGFLSVAYVIVKGRNLSTGQLVEERQMPRN